MEFFKIRKDIPFMRHALVFNVISLITFLLAVFFLATNGLHYSIEFTGGTVIEIVYDHSAEIQKVRGALEKAGYADTSVQNFGSSRDVLVRLPSAQPLVPHHHGEHEREERREQRQRDVHRDPTSCHLRWMEPTSGLEPETSSLPRTCSAN